MFSNSFVENHKGLIYSFGKISQTAEKKSRLRSGVSPVTVKHLGRPDGPETSGILRRKGFCRPPVDGRQRLLVLVVVNRFGPLDDILFDPLGFSGAFRVFYLEFADIGYVAFI